MVKTNVDSDKIGYEGLQRYDVHLEGHTHASMKEFQFRLGQMPPLEGQPRGRLAPLG